MPLLNLTSVSMPYDFRLLEKSFQLCESFRADLTSLAISYLIRSLGQSLSPCLGFAFAEGQTVFLLQFLADAHIPLQPVAVGDAFAVVVHTIEDEVAMGIGFRSTWRQSSDRRG